MNTTRQRCECYDVKVLVGSMALGLIWLMGCDPDIKGKCYKNEECIENYLCNKENQCVEVDQENLEILSEELDDAVVGKQYSFELSARGGLPPYTWTIINGPGWLKTEKNNDTGAWMLVGETAIFNIDAAAVEISVADSSIGNGQTTNSINLSIRALYCFVNQEPAEVCSGHGTCGDEGLCNCNVGHAGNQCDVCDQENGYELNDKDECVRYEYKCEPPLTCGANILKCECVGQECEDASDCEPVDDCTESNVCWVDGENYGCNDCQGYGCTDGVCNGCSAGACCDNGVIKPDTEKCDEWIEYKCNGSCGGQRQEGTFVKKCDGQTTDCTGTVNDTWITLSTCADNAWCNPQGIDTPPICSQCDHVCFNGACADCDPNSNGCCTSEGTLIAGCWYDPEMNLAWQDPPLPLEPLWIWENYKNACNNLVLEDKSDWRLPTITELRSLIRDCSETQVTPSSTGDCGVLDDCLSTDCYVSDKCDGCQLWQGPGQSGCYWDPDLHEICSMYWSSSSVDGGTSTKWVVAFDRGYVGNRSVFHNFSYARCVRRGP